MEKISDIFVNNPLSKKELKGKFENTLNWMKIKKIYQICGIQLKDWLEILNFKKPYEKNQKGLKPWANPPSLEKYGKVYRKRK